MDQELLVDKVLAGADFVRRFHEQVPVKAAFWLRPSENRHLYLYIVLEQDDDEAEDRGNWEVIRLAQLRPTPHLSPYQIILISADNYLARTALGLLALYPGDFTSHVGGLECPGIDVDGTWVYPSTLTEPVAS